MVTNSPGPCIIRLLFLVDHTRRLRFIVDAGAEVSRKIDRNIHHMLLTTATFGEHLHQLDLS